MNRAIAYHDPNGRWERGAFEVSDLSSRPDGTSRRTVLRFDNAQSRFEMETLVDSRALKIVVASDTAEVRLDGRAELSADELERYRLTPAQVLTKRNFYLYLYGLPMKLRGPGTRLDPKTKDSLGTEVPGMGNDRTRSRVGRLTVPPISQTMGRRLVGLRQRSGAAWGSVRRT